MDRLIENDISLIPDPAAGLEQAVREAIAALRPILQRDGGDISLIAIDEDIVVVDMKGACSGCVLASVTLAGIRKRLIDAVGRPLKVVPRSAMAMIKREAAA